MELSERWLKKFEHEGFVSIYEWEDPAGTVYQAHKHQGKVSLFVTDGAITFTFPDKTQVISSGERFDVPIGVTHSAVVGPQGWRAVVAEEIKGDS